LKRKVFHLSHIDLDGYGCQVISSRVYKNVEYFNSSYGQEIDDRLSSICKRVKSGDLVLITDLNLDMAQSKYIDKKSKEMGFELLLLDHHKTGKECADSFEWYILDVNRSATKITYDYFKSKVDIADLKYYVECINAYDIWLQNEVDKFELGKVLARYVTEAKEINRVMFSNENYKYISYILENAIKYVNEEDAYIKLDDMLHSIKKSFFMKDKNDTLENLVSKYIVSLLTKNKDSMTVEFEGKKGILTYSIGNTSIIGNSFLKANPEYDFFLDVNSKKNISARADNRYDVAKMARKLFSGGGHANAAGGKFLEFKESFVYEDIKGQVQKLMKNC
jgi:oligoribonuclease NrnB/cAMP/cGMP phosphodiesterase (DHH superfamily)